MGVRLSQWALAPLISFLCCSACATDLSDAATIGGDIRISIREGDKVVDCAGLLKGARGGDEYACIAPNGAGLQEHVNRQLLGQDFIAALDSQFGDEFCRGPDLVTTFLIGDPPSLSGVASAIDEYISTAPVGIGFWAEDCADYFAKNARIANELGFRFLGYDRTIDVFTSLEAGAGISAFEYEPSATNRLAGFKVIPAPGTAAASRKNVSDELARLKFVKAPTNPIMGGQAYCRGKDESLFQTVDSEDVLANELRDGQYRHDAPIILIHVARVDCGEWKEN